MKESIKRIVISIIIGITIVGVAYLVDQVNRKKLIGNKEGYNTVVEIEPEQEELSRNIIKFGGAITVILVVTYFIITGEDVKTKQYRREWEEVLSPVLAESVVDGKVGVKELIMTTIADLATRGNIEIIDNQTIHFINMVGLETYEEKIVNMLFQKETIQFSEIKDIFQKDNEATGKIYEQIAEIKELIIRTLENRKIYSKAKRIGIEIIRATSIMAIVTILLTIVMKDITLPIIIFPWLILLFVAIKQEKGQLRKRFTGKKEKLTVEESVYKFIVIGIVVLLFLVILLEATYFPNMMIIGIMVAILTILALSPTKCTYTEQGIREKRKVLELKNYIVQYSLMKERDLADTILWDKYLAYAIAFGITNKITDKVYSEWLTTNIALQVIDDMIRLY